MSKRWTLKDDQFLAEFHEMGADFIASHDLGFTSKGAGEKRMAKLKEVGVWDKLLAHIEARKEMQKAHTLAFGPQWAKELFQDEGEGV